MLIHAKDIYSLRKMHFYSFMNVFNIFVICLNVWNYCELYVMILYCMEPEFTDVLPK